ncbi:MAG: lysophospholipid acyltransferase family protein [Bacteroidales bacterium]
MWSKIGIFFLKQLARVPFWSLYALSDVLFFFVYHVVRYRRDVVITNLRNSFPEKDNEELKHIRKEYFKHMCDILLEAFKMYRMPIKEWNKRYKYPNIDVLNAAYQRGNSVALFSMHYANWEWGVGFQDFIHANAVYIYRQLSNKAFDKYNRELRAIRGGSLVEAKQALRRMLDNKQKGILEVYWFGADQSPADLKGVHWTNFLNQDTAFYMGGAKISQRIGCEIMFMRVKKIKRGYYEMWVEEMFKDSSEIKPEQIVEEYAHRGEAQIRAKPEYWMWSHRRWKRKRQTIDM